MPALYTLFLPWALRDKPFGDDSHDSDHGHEGSEEEEQLIEVTLARVLFGIELLFLPEGL